MHCHISMSQYVCTFICIKNFMIKLENIHKVVRIDNILSASDHGMNHICKLVIESKTLVVLAWWTPKEFRQMSTICNYLKDGIWIADDVRVLKSSISMAVTISITYVALSRLRKISIMWRPSFSRCVSLRMLSTLNTFKWTGVCSSTSLNFLLLVPLVWGVEALYCCNLPSLGIVLSLFTTPETCLSSLPLLNQLLLFAVKVQPHLSLYSWWLIV